MIGGVLNGGLIIVIIFFVDEFLGKRIRVNIVVLGLVKILFLGKLGNSEEQQREIYEQVVGRLSVGFVVSLEDVVEVYFYVVRVDYVNGLMIVIGEFYYLLNWFEMLEGVFNGFVIQMVVVFFDWGQKWMGMYNLGVLGSILKLRLRCKGLIVWDMLEMMFKDCQWLGSVRNDYGNKNMLVVLFSLRDLINVR